jgi:hypothetical protein
VVEYTFALAATENRQVREGTLRIRGNVFEQHLKAGEHPLDGAVIEKLGAVLDAGDESIRGVEHVHAQVELRRPHFHLGRICLPIVDVAFPFGTG